MPSNQQRREAAKRKLERQLERRAQQERRRKTLTIVGLIVGLIVIGGLVWLLVALTRGDDTDNTAAASTDELTTSPNAPGELPTPIAKPATVNCEYPVSPQPAAKPVAPPRTEGIPTADGNETVSVSMQTNQGPIGLTLDNAHAPCTVNSFVSLASQGFFDNTECHRMTSADSLRVLQCGDPTATGTGGPGYQFANEYPTDQYAADDPGVQVPVPYARGVIAMANAGPDTNGSQFFLVYGDSQLPPMYTIFGTIDETGLATLDTIAAGGIAGGGQDGAPAQPVQITSVRQD